MEKKLTRNPNDAVLGGVASGMADYFNIDKTIIRVLWAVALLLPIPPTFFWTAIVYIILWAALPEGVAGNTYTTYGTDPGNPTPPVSPSSAREPGVSSNSSDPDRAVKIIGVVLLGIGAIMLLDELPYWYQIREYIWPLALIGVGAYLLLRQRDKEKYSNDTVTPPPADPTPPVSPFPPVDPDPVPYRPFDSSSNPSIDPDAPSDPDGETGRNEGGPQIR